MSKTLVAGLAGRMDILDSIQNVTYRYRTSSLCFLPEDSVGLKQWLLPVFVDLSCSLHDLVARVAVAGLQYEQLNLSELDLPRTPEPLSG
jgi:hypothetical protein